MKLLQMKALWVDSRRDNAEEEALKIKVVVEFWQLRCLDDSSPMYSGSYTSLACFFLPPRSLDCHSPVVEISQAQRDGI